MSQMSRISRMSSTRKSKLDLDPERIVLIDESFDGVSLTSNSFRKANGNFCRVRYANNQELIINIESQIVFLLNYIYEKMLFVGLHSSRQNIDLVDLNAELKNLRREAIKHEYGSTILTNRSTYILVDVVENTDITLSDFPQVTALLDDSEFMTPNFLARLANINAPVVKPAKVVLEKEKKKQKLVKRKKSTGSTDSLKIS